jgi:cytosine/adenosine deaminase-related metal-dependent hydrolase
MVLEMATLGGAACLGRTGELGVLTPGAVGDVAVWSLTGPAFAGAVADPIEAWLRCGPISARDTIVHGTRVVADGHLVHAAVEDRLRAHRAVAERLQARA